MRTIQKEISKLILFNIKAKKFGLGRLKIEVSIRRKNKTEKFFLIQRLQDENSLIAVKDSYIPVAPNNYLLEDIYDKRP